MNSERIRTASAIVSVTALTFVILGSLLTMSWEGEPIQFTSQNLGEALFSSYGPTLIILGVLMFAAMLGGVYIGQEERE
ncbi:MAG: NADH-quinone oxidoreductase subunit J [Methanomassiliicoccales archaeon]